ncbi:MAG: ABC transporter ATP-binding protein, partial [Bacteroidales bacterium]|nr:ABC transporter ATP-binding protein [Bacteroidales bacterium]
GSYSDYNKQKKQVERQISKTTKQENIVEKPKSTTKPKKLSYKEKKELEQIELELQELEEKKENLQNELNSGNLASDDLVQKSKELTEIMDTLDEKEMRWLELKEIEDN